MFPNYPRDYGLDRSKSISIRFSEKESADLKKVASKYRLSKTEYARRILCSAANATVESGVSRKQVFSSFSSYGRTRSSVLRIPLNTDEVSLIEKASDLTGLGNSSFARDKILSRVHTELNGCS
jgi:hypothetical protein